MERYKKVTYINVKLKKRRKQAGLSQRKLANLANLNKTSIYFYENGICMSEKTWVKIKKIFKKYE